MFNTVTPNLTGFNFDGLKHIRQFAKLCSSPILPAVRYNLIQPSTCIVHVHCTCTCCLALLIKIHAHAVTVMCSLTIWLLCSTFSLTWHVSLLWSLYSSFSSLQSHISIYRKLFPFWQCVWNESWRQPMECTRWKQSMLVWDSAHQYETSHDHQLWREIIRYTLYMYM